MVARLRLRDLLDSFFLGALLRKCQSLEAVPLKMNL